MSKLVVLIQSVERRGAGVVGDPIRCIQTFWTVDGKLVFEKDDYKPDAPEVLRHLADEFFANEGVKP